MACQWDVESDAAPGSAESGLSADREDVEQRWGHQATGSALRSFFGDCALDVALLPQVCSTLPHNRVASGANALAQCRLWVERVNSAPQ